MAVKLFNWHSRRAQLSRYGRHISTWVTLIEFSVVLLIGLGIGGLLLGLSVGWALIGVMAVPLMVAYWYWYELHMVPREEDTHTIDARMDSDLLALLGSQPTPKDIALALLKVNSGVFFDVRFGVGGRFLKEVASENREDTPVIFEEALRIASQLDGRVSGGGVIVAMVRQLSARDTLLGHLQLTEEDLMRGVKWYHYLDEMIQQRGKRKRSGGIGRDWSFGWIPTLSHFGVNISTSGTVSRGEVRPELVEQLMGTLGSGGGTIALVGRDGVGKTELVYELAAKLIGPDTKTPKDLWYQQIFMLDASRLLSVGGQRGRVEQLVSTVLGEAYAAKNVIVCFDNAELFFEEGVGSVDITSQLLPIVEAGRLRMILAINEQKFLSISKRTPALVAAMNKVMVAPTDESDTMKVLEDHIPGVEYKRKVTYMYQALKETYSLSQRYVYDLAMPGQAVRLMEQAAEYADNGLVTSRSVQLAVERATGIKAGTADDVAEKETLLNLEGLLHQRMIGQERAIQVVSDALRRARSGVRNQGRPVGTFLFLGPTGVGKTELAKSLAEVYFGGEDTMIRLDMNEFVSADDVQRLIADGADDPGSLTAQVMKRPFSVVLLDEIEKAHSSVLTTLLQLLDEGILRDVRGREISFRDCVVIATSNAGADRIQEYITRGYALAHFEENFINELIGSHVFHPEFLNRFDEMVVFGPLTKEQLLKVVDLMLVGVNKNLAGQKITVSVSDDAKEYLVEAGYDPRLGARPMRRVVQRAVENTVAKLLLSNEAAPGSTIEITRDQVEEMLSSRLKADTLAEENK